MKHTKREKRGDMFKQVLIKLYVIGALFFLINSTASALPLNFKGQAQSKKLTLEQKKEIYKYNSDVTQSGAGFLFSGSNSALTVKRPVAEYEDAGYLLFYADTEFNSADVKVKLVQNLPTGVTAVIYTDSDDQNELEALYRFYSSKAPSVDQVKIITIENLPIQISYKDGGSFFSSTEDVYPNGFWSRDTIPVPVIEITNLGAARALSDKFAVVDAKYYHHYEKDQVFADYFNADLLTHNYYFEGGNFMANAKGDCLVINSEEVDIIPNSIFSRTYGCSNLIRLPYLKGIGHADESVKFISDDHVLTDDRRYKKILEAKGFTVTMLPRPKRDYETYVNSLLINNVMWVPVFGQTSDKAALDVYSQLGFKVVAVDSGFLSNVGAGSVHCITMTYPKTTDFNELLDYFGAKLVNTSVSNNPKVLRAIEELEDQLQHDINALKDPGLDAYFDSMYNEGWL